jgi:hypothetical protein
MAKQTPFQASVLEPYFSQWPAVVKEFTGNKVSVAVFIVAGVLNAIGWVTLTASPTAGSLLVFCGSIGALFFAMPLFSPNHEHSERPLGLMASDRYRKKHPMVVEDYLYHVTPIIARAWYNHPEGTITGIV